LKVFSLKLPPSCSSISGSEPIRNSAKELKAGRRPFLVARPNPIPPMNILKRRHHPMHLIGQNQVMMVH
jgi:hypothetical protein